MEQEPNNPNKESPLEDVQEKDPYAGIFFEIDTLMKQGEAACVERLRPLTVREPTENELYAILEVFNYQDFGLNYNTVSKELDINFEQLGDVSVIPGLQEHIESFLEGKTTSQEQNENFDTKLRAKLFDFFSRCWKQAGGEQARIPTYFCFEEEEDELKDLQTGEVMSEEEVVSKLKSN